MTKIRGLLLLFGYVWFFVCLFVSPGARKVILSFHPDLLICSYPLSSQKRLFIYLNFTTRNLVSTLIKVIKENHHSLWNVTLGQIFCKTVLLQSLTTESLLLFIFSLLLFNCCPQKSKKRQYNNKWFSPLYFWLTYS